MDKLIEMLQQLVNGVSLGSIYALIALGYTMVYGVLRFINFAHGDIYMLGAYAGFLLAPLFAHIFKFGDVRVFIDPKSFIYLRGMVLDWEDTLMRQGFLFNNPNATKSCGCGTSFS